MKLHSTTIERLVSIYETYGGYKNESKLRSQLQEVDFSAYTRETGEKILVLTDDLTRESTKE